MDCTDLVIGSAKGMYSRIGDYYTRDRSTPMFDPSYGGEDSLTAAIGEENGGFTNILFRRKLSSKSDKKVSIRKCTRVLFSIHLKLLTNNLKLQ